MTGIAFADPERRSAFSHVVGIQSDESAAGGVVSDFGH
jgi:hypothetical protein